jgi:glycosyltransferase involved in cell wall biosynthesis
LIDWEKVPANKIELIPHGFLLKNFSSPSEEIVTNLRKKYDIIGRRPVIGVISRFIELKGVHYIIPAFHEVLSTYPDAVLLLFNAEGDYSKSISHLLSSLPQKNYRTILFEPEIAAAYHLMDVCIHVPIANHLEAFGQVYIESLAAGVPLVCTLSGIANDIMIHKKNSWIVPYENASEIANGIRSILFDDPLRENIIHGGKETVQAFSLQRMIENLEKMYDRS